MNAERFDIDGALLAGPTGDARWNNLGYWRETADYTGACAALARLHGQVAGLKPDQCVLELACGQGASFDIWARDFAVGRISALEYRQSSVSAQSVSARSVSAYALARSPLPLEIDVALGRFDSALPESLAGQVFDAVLCVDAAYHARSLQDFARTAAGVLAPDGMLVFSTLLRPAAAEPRPARSAPTCSAPACSALGMRRGLGRVLSDIVLSVLLKTAAIPPGSILTADDLRATLQHNGLARIEIQDLSASVFAGFARWVEHRHRQLSWRQRWSPGWLKIRVTGRWCASIDRRRLLRYVLVSAQRE